MPNPRRVVLLFLDGVGIGPDDPASNPFLRAASSTPTLLKLLGGEVPTLDRPGVAGPDGRSFPLDARQDIEGTPQSGTGQAALLTGEDAARIFGRHFGPWTPVRLRPVVEERSVLNRASRAGRRVAFANAYPRGWPGPKGGRRIAAPPLAARGAGVLDRHEEALGRGEAVSSEIVNDGWRRHLGHDWLPEVTPEVAGANLARVVGTADLTLFAHYSTDTVGHRRSMVEAIDSIVQVDRFLQGLLDGIDDQTLVLVASDHGNLEDVRAGHTLNPVLGIARGPGAERASRMTDIREVTPFLLESLSSATPSARSSPEASGP